MPLPSSLRPPIEHRAKRKSVHAFFPAFGTRPSAAKIAGRRHRQRSNAHADRVVDRIADRGSRRNIRRLGDSIGIGCAHGPTSRGSRRRSAESRSCPARSCSARGRRSACAPERHSRIRSWKQGERHAHAAPRPAPGSRFGADRSVDRSLAPRPCARRARFRSRYPRQPPRSLTPPRSPAARSLHPPYAGETRLNCPLARQPRSPRSPV